MNDVTLGGHAAAPEGEHTIWHRAPVDGWDNACFLGNGSLGLSVFGEINRERLNINLDTLYAGGPHSSNNPEGPKALPEIIDLLRRNRIVEAETLWLKSIRGDYPRITPFSKLGNVWLNMADKVDAATDYRRSLDLETSVFEMQYTASGVTYRRELLVSHVDQVFALRIECDRLGCVSFAIELDAPDECGPVYESLGDDGATMRGHNPSATFAHARGGADQIIEGALDVALVARVLAEGGSTRNEGARVIVEGADSAVILLASDTSYVRYDDFSKDAMGVCLERVEAAASQPYESLRERHIADIRPLFGRMSLDLGDEPLPRLPTDERLARWREELAAGRDSSDLALVSLTLQFMRYSWLAASRQGGQPMTVVGLWNELPFARWGGVWANNINGPQLYWGVEELGLPECHEPWLRMVSELPEHGATTARETFGLPGWCVWLRTDLWRHTAIEASAICCNAFPSGGPWLCHHLWEAYLFSGDREFLARIYPVLKGMAEFQAAYLVRDEVTGKLLAGPGTSVEWRPFGLGVTVSQMTAFDGISNAIQASEILGVDEELRERLRETREAMAPLQIGEEGHLPEWRIGQTYDYGGESAIAPDNSPDVDFRHMTHLYALHPAAQISHRQTPELADALRLGLERRKPAQRTSFMMGRKINAFARFEDGEVAWQWTREMIAVYAFDNLGFGHDPGPKTVHFEGNGSWSCGVAEMLVQSHDGAIHLAPALPEAWREGRVMGLRARGGFVIEELKWRDGQIASATILSTIGGVCRIRSGDAIEARGIASRPAESENPNPLFQRALWGEGDDHRVDPVAAEERSPLNTIEFDTTPGQRINLETAVTSGEEPQTIASP